VLYGSHIYGVSSNNQVEAVAVLTVVLYVYCLILAVNSSVHRFFPFPYFPLVRTADLHVLL